MKKISNPSTHTVSVEHFTTMGIVPNTIIRDDRFDISDIENSHLLIEVSHDRLCFCVLNTSTQTYVWLEDYRFSSLFADENWLLHSLNSIYREHRFLPANYWKSIKVVFNSPLFTFIPQELYQSEEESKYLQLMGGRGLDREQAYSYSHPVEGFVNVFAVRKDWLDWFKEMYPVRNIQPHHRMSALVKGIHKMSQNQNDLHLIFEEHAVTIIYFKEQNLHFCNRFEFKSPQDLVYYVLFVMNELGLHPNDTHVKLYGEITSFSDSFLALNRSLQHINFGKNVSGFKYSQYFDDLPDHRYFGIYSTHYL